MMCSKIKSIDEVYTLFIFFFPRSHRPRWECIQQAKRRVRFPHRVWEPVSVRITHKK